MHLSSLLVLILFKIVTLQIILFLRAIEGAVGYGDPRDIKDFLESKGIACWIDVERVGVVC